MGEFIEDLDEVIQRSTEAGVKKIIIPGIDLESSRRAVEISQSYESCFAAVGIHPNESASANSEILDQIRAMAREPRVVAIGEIGLDLFWDYASLAAQIEILQHMLEIASDMRLPVLLHSRSAVSDLARIIKAWHFSLSTTKNPLVSAPGIMHAFEGTLEEATSFQELGFAIGLGGAWTYGKSRVDPLIVTKIPLTSFVFETDSPYLTPVPWRGQRNEPSYLPLTVASIAKKTNTDSVELCKISTNTANKIFNLE